MQVQSDKENTIRNSKLEMSIKPFTVSREDLAKSKSVDKGRKGLSRVNNGAHPWSGNQAPVQPPPTYQFYSSALTNPGPALGNMAIGPQQHPHRGPASSDRQEANRNAEFDLQCKVELLQKQLVVLEKENIDISRERNEWKQKCHQLYEANQCWQNKLNQMKTQLVSLAAQLAMKQEEVTGNQQQIRELTEASRQNSSLLAQSNEKVLYLTKQLHSSMSQIVEQQRHLSQLIKLDPSNQRDEQLSLMAHELKALKSEKSQLEQAYRQLLIRSSAATNEILVLQGRLRSIQSQRCNDQEDSDRLIQECRTLQQKILQLEEEAVFGRACRQQLEEIQDIRQLNKELADRNKEYERKIRQFEQKRLNQIEFHQEEMRKLCESETSKFQALVQLYKKQRDEAEKGMNQARASYLNMEHNQKMLIDSINLDYQAIIVELKDKLTKMARQKDGLQLKHSLESEEKQMQIAELVEKLKSLKDDNSFLIVRLEENLAKNAQRAETETLRRSRERPVSNQHRQMVNSLQNEINDLAQTNKQINSRLCEYEVEFIRLSDKIHILQVDAEKYKSKEDSYERKIRHLTQEVEHAEIVKNKQISQKIKLLEEVQNLKLSIKNREIQFKLQEEAVSDSVAKIRILDQKLANAESKLASYQNHLEQKTKRAQQLESDLGLLKQQLCLSHSNLDHLTKFYESTIKTLSQDLQRQAKRARLSEEENKMSQQKLKLKQYRTQKQEEQVKEAKLSIIRQHLAILGTNLDLMETSQNNALLLLGKAIRGTVQTKSEIQAKLNKVQSQYRELSEAEEATRLLAQKYHQKCLELQRLLIKIEQAHEEKLILVKKDYDIVYAKYLKYRNMVISQNKQRSKQKALRR